MVDHAVDVCGANGTGMIREDNLLGDEYTNYIKSRAHMRGVSVVADVRGRIVHRRRRGAGRRGRDAGGGRTGLHVRRLRRQRIRDPGGLAEAGCRGLRRGSDHHVHLHGHDRGADAVHRAHRQLRGLGRGRPVRRAQPDVHVDARPLREAVRTPAGALLYRAGLRHGQCRRARAGQGQAALARRSAAWIWRRSVGSTPLRVVRATTSRSDPTTTAATRATSS